MLVALAANPQWATKCHVGGGGIVVRSGLEPRASRYPWDNWGVEPYGRPLTFGCEEYTKEMEKKKEK